LSVIPREPHIVVELDIDMRSCIRIGIGSIAGIVGGRERGHESLRGWPTDVLWPSAVGRASRRHCPSQSSGDEPFCCAPMSIQFACLPLSGLTKTGLPYPQVPSAAQMQQRVKQLVAVQEDVSYAAVKFGATG
jgi:hypothetical protein